MKLFFYWLFVVVPSLLLCGSGIMILQQKWMLYVLDEDNSWNIDFGATRYVSTIFFILLPLSLILLYKNSFVITHKGKLSLGIATIGVISIFMALLMDK